MSPQEINVKIAEACGWTRFGKSSGPISSGKALLGSWKTGDYGTPPEDREKPEDDQSFEPIPNYCGDLNAMHEAENQLPTEDRMHYIKLLYQHTGHPVEGGNSWYLCHATAAQRAEAFLKTIGKWSENKKEQG